MVAWPMLVAGFVCVPRPWRDLLGAGENPQQLRELWQIPIVSLEVCVPHQCGPCVCYMMSHVDEPGLMTLSDRCQTQ